MTAQDERHTPSWFHLFLPFPRGFDLIGCANRVLMKMNSAT